MSAEARLRQRRAVSLDAVWFVTAGVAPALFMLVPKMSTIDIAYLIRSGDIMLREHHVLTVDPFGLATIGQRWVNQQWGSELFFAGLFRIGGWPALVVVRSILIASVFWLVFATARRRGAAPAGAGIATLVAFLVGLGLDLRAELLGMVLFAAAAWILSVRSSRSWLIWLVPLLVIFDVNVHGSFLLIPAIVSIAVVDELASSRRLSLTLVVVTLACIAATLANPFGPSVWRYAVGLSTNPSVTRVVREWRPTTVRSQLGVLFFSSVLAVLVVLAVARRRPGVDVLLTIGLFFFVGLYAIRGIAWWAVAVAPVVAPYVPALKSEARALPTRMVIPLATVLFVCLVALLPWWRTGTTSDALLRFGPSRLTSALNQYAGPDARMFNPQLFGSWFELSLSGTPTFVDARIEVPPPHVWDDYFRISAAASGWRSTLTRWRFDVIVATPEQQGPLIRALTDDPSWRLVYTDSDGSIFVPAGPSGPAKDRAEPA